MQYTLVFLELELRSGIYTFLANIVLQESIEESADDITAAASAPRPITATAGGVR